MKENLLIVHSLFNLLTAINLKLQYMDNADIIVSDYSPQLRDIYRSGQLEKIFDHVYFADCTLRYQGRVRRLLYVKFLSVFRGLLPDIALRIYLGKKIDKYKNLYFWNPEPVTDALYKRDGKETVLHLYGDSNACFIVDKPDREIKGYTKQSIRGYVKILFEKLFRLSTIYYSTLPYDYYIYCPDLYSGKTERKLKQITMFTLVHEGMKPIVNDIFAYQQTSVKSRIIFFDLADDWEKNDKEEKLKILKKLKDQYGKDIAIKVHPRGDMQLFEKENFELIKINYPWEIFCMNCDTDDKIFITLCSGAAIMPYILFSTRAKVIFMDQILYCPSPNIPRYHKWIEELGRKGAPVFSPKNTAEFYKLITQLMKG